MEAESITKVLAEVYRRYAGMAEGMDPESGLGGRLLFAGELGADGQALVRAANVAGAASLSAAADPAAGRQAMREGVVDFLVTSLDEALRILKNEIRKRQSVAVGVTTAAETLAVEMLDRGVLPDLLPVAKMSGHYAEFAAQGTRRVEPRLPADGTVFVAVNLGAHPSRAAEIDSRLMGVLENGDELNRRWLRHSPRYLPRQLRNWRSAVCDEARAEMFRALASE